jgi:hypothetical protein
MNETEEEGEEEEEVEVRRNDVEEVRNFVVEGEYFMMGCYRFHL